jgi:hypothetical protein
LIIDQDAPDLHYVPQVGKKERPKPGTRLSLLTLRQFPPFRQQDNTILANPPVRGQRNIAVSALQYAAF